MSIRHSLTFAFIDRYASLAVGIVASMILARLLTPEEVGVYSVAMALLALVATVRDMGAGQYLVREKELTPDRIRAVWSVQLGIGFLLGALVLAASGPAAAFFREPAMGDIMLLLSLNYLVNPFGSITYAWLVRQMRYDSIAVMRFSSTLVGTAVSVILAWLGYGAISLAWGSLCGTLANAATSMMFRPQAFPWMPGLREIGRVLTFGGQITTTSVLRTIASAAPEFLLGRFQSLAAAGFYSRAFGLVAMFDRLVMDAVGNVSVALFSKEARENRDSKPSFLRALAYVTVLSWPFSATLALLAFPATRTLYGTQWDSSVDLTRWLSAGMGFLSVVPICTAALIGANALRLLMKVTATIAVASVLAAFIGAQLGLWQIGATLLISSAVACIASLQAVLRTLDLRWSDVWYNVKSSALVAALTGAAPALVIIVAGARPSQTILALVVGIGGAALGFLLGLRLVSHPLLAEVTRAVPFLARWLGR